MKSYQFGTVSSYAPCLPAPRLEQQHGLPVSYLLARLLTRPICRVNVMSVNMYITATKHDICDLHSQLGGLPVTGQHVNLKAAAVSL
jgi:hypothetical protein